jgi:hypothetical protein
MPVHSNIETEWEQNRVTANISYRTVKYSPDKNILSKKRRNGVWSSALL